MHRLSRRAVVASGLGALVAGCTRGPVAESAAPARQAVYPKSYGYDALKPLDLSIENLTKITVCTRPFRPAGPRLEAVDRGAKRIVHNYGHGGSGWSLAWGYAEAARALAAEGRPIEVAVLGAGAIGLTSAIALAQAGARVTIYAREMPMEARSARATGVWSPTSRIGLASAVDPDFAGIWEMVARRSYARHLTYVGRAGHPVEFTPRFYIRHQPREAPLVAPGERADDFLDLDDALRGMTPPWIERSDTPFPSERSVRGGLVMTFNIAEYTGQLVEDFQAMGGRIVRAEVASEAEMTALPGEVVVNCSGYEAKALVGDETLVPVRGQIAWMAPQTDRLYGIYHRGVMVLSRRDGLLIQETGGNDLYGYGEANETADRAEFLAAHAKVAPMFEWG